MRARARWLAAPALVLLVVSLSYSLARCQGTPAGPAPMAAQGAAADLPELSAEQLLAQPRATSWRLARWRGHPQVLVIEFPSLAEQGLALNRAAALLEKAGAPRDRVLSPQELAALIERSGDSPASFYQGHDYRAAQLARFFALAQQQGVALNASEERLRQLLLRHRLLPASEPTQVLVSFTAEQADDPASPQDELVDAVRRRAVLLHELSHGRFFTSDAYRALCRRFWREGLSLSERSQWRTLLASLHYDVTDEDLLVNEMQALLLHTPDERAFSADALGVTDAELLAQWQRFQALARAHGG